MIEPKLLIRVADVAIVAYVMLLVGIGIWTIKGRVPALVQKKYSTRVISNSQLPFAYQWWQAVSPEDLPAFEQARCRQQVFFIVITGIVFLILMYAYLNAAAMLHLCQLRRAGL